MDRYDPQKRVVLMVGEWGTWHRVEPGTNPGFLYQQNTPRDALAPSITLDIFNSHADRVRMANIAQTINVLQAMILTQGSQMILTPTYHVFDFYTVHHDATRLPLSIDAESYVFSDRSIPAVSATASRDKNGKIHLTITNVDPNRAHIITADISGAHVSRVAGRILTAGTMNAHSTFAQPSRVVPESFDGTSLTGQTLRVELPQKSLVVLALE